MKRGAVGEKHPGHIYREYAAIAETDENTAVKYAPIGVGDTIEVDTTVFDTIDYSDIVRRIRTLIAKHQKEGTQ